MFSDIFFTLFHDFLLSVTEKRASPRSLEGGGKNIKFRILLTSATAFRRGTVRRFFFFLHFQHSFLFYFVFF